MSFEGLLAELLVTSVFDGVKFHAVRVGVDVMVLGEHVADRVERCNNEEHHADDHLVVRYLALTEVSDVLSDIMSHLGSACWGTVVVLNHAIMELRGHSDDHVVKVGIEVAALRDVMAKGSIVVVASQQIVGVVGETRLVSGCFGELRGPHTLVGLLSLMHSHVRWPDAVVDLALAEVPFLEIVTLVFLMRRVQLRKVDHLLTELSLVEALVNEQVVLLMHGTVAALARAGEHLEASAKSKFDSVKLWLRVTLTWRV